MSSSQVNEAREVGKTLGYIHMNLRGCSWRCTSRYSENNEVPRGPQAGVALEHCQPGGSLAYLAT